MKPSAKGPRFLGRWAPLYFALASSMVCACRLRPTNVLQLLRRRRGNIVSPKIPFEYGAARTHLQYSQHSMHRNRYTHTHTRTHIKHTEWTTRVPVRQNEGLYVWVRENGIVNGNEERWVVEMRESSNIRRKKNIKFSMQMEGCGIFYLHHQPINRNNNEHHHEW